MMVATVWSVAVVFSITGLALLGWSLWKPLRGLRRRGRACAACGYPMATGSSRCPECGTEYGATSSPTRRVVGVILAGIRVAIALALFAPLFTLIWPFRAARVIEPLFVTWIQSSRTEMGASTFVEEELAFRTEWLGRAAQEIQRFNVYVGMEAGALQRGRLIDRSGRVAFTTEGRSVQLGSPYPPGTSADANPGEFASVAPGIDIDANAIPDVIVSTFSGGAHCCWEYAVVELGDHPHVTYQMDSAVGARFTLDPSPDGNTTLIQTADTTWAYWNTSYADSPMPGVTMRFSHGKATIAASMMREPAPTSEELAAEAARVRDLIRAERRASVEKDLSVADYWRTPINLMYAGHEDLAWTFFDDAWPKDVAGKEAFLKQFRELLDQSVYWSRVKEAFSRG